MKNNNNFSMGYTFNEEYNFGIFLDNLYNQSNGLFNNINDFNNNNGFFNNFCAFFFFYFFIK